MLKRLSVENYALIDRLDIEFAPGLNIVTGETGAGKSILLGALGLILGNRADGAVWRHDDRNCVIEGEFDVAGYELEPLFERLDVDYESPCLIRRIITPAGKSRSYVNDQPVPLTTLREIGIRLIDIHSQHQTLLLADNSFQTGVVDAVAGHAALLKSYGQTYERLRTAERELEGLRRQAEESSRDREYVTFQWQELQEAKLKEGEQQELELLLGELTHAAEIKEALLFAAQTLDADEEGVLTRLKSLEMTFGRLQKVYPSGEAYCVRLHSALLDLKDLTGEIASEADRLESDPDRLDRTQQRLDLIYTLQQKHKVDSVEALLALQAEYAARLASIEGYGERIESLQIRIGELTSQAQELAERIREGRRRAAEEVERYVVERLVQLGMPAARLQVEIVPVAQLRPDGADEIRFLFTANRNMALQPIEKVASGGEMSRLMLSLKALIASHAQMPTLIFDEIDTGVSGSIADRMGEIMASLAENLQIINITHLPQVASKGDHHFLVYKQEGPSGTAPHIRKLTPSERIEQIAQMISGSDITLAALEQARLLLGL